MRTERPSRTGRSPSDVVQALYPEVGAGGFTRVDGTIEFYGRINSLVSSQSSVVDLGAGRAAWLADPVPYRQQLRNLQGRVGRLVGVDVDDAVLRNPTVDEAMVMPDPGTIPLPDASADAIIADYVLEHIEDAPRIAAEIQRVLRSGGWFCARTPNRKGMTALAARLVPNAAHVSALRVLQPHKQAEDTFPTRYRMNDLATIRSLFPSSSFLNCSYTFDSEPGYVGGSSALLRVLDTIKRFTPRRYGETLMVFVQKL
jgi:SAM-dependent methyltransferase